MFSDPVTFLFDVFFALNPSYSYSSLIFGPNFLLFFSLIHRFPYCKNLSLRFEYLREIEAKFENSLACQSMGPEGLV